MRSRLVTAVVLGVPLLVAPLAVGSSAAYAGGGDATPPTVVSVSSTDYPSSDSGGTSTLHAGQPGRFTIDTADVGGGLRRVEWLLDDDLATGSKPDRSPVSGWQSLELAPTASTTVTVTPPRWGTTVLSVRAVDRGGRVSQTSQYVFSVPRSTEPQRDGDLTGDGIPDVLTADTTGDLRVHPGTVGGGLGTSYVASTAAEAPVDGWADAVVTHRGNGSGGVGEELVVWSQGSMRTYRNNGIGSFSADQASTVTHPTCAGCVGYPSSWVSLTGMVALGVGGVGTPRLLTVEAGRAWLYPRFLGLRSVTPVTLEGVDLASADLVAPGDVTGDGLDDLWVRDRMSGGLTQFAGTETGLASAGTVLARRGYDVVNFPVVTSVGDLSGDGVGDLLTLTAAGSLQRRSATALSVPVRISSSVLGQRAATVENQSVGPASAS